MHTFLDGVMEIKIQKVIATKKLRSEETLIIIPELRRCDRKKVRYVSRTNEMNTYQAMRLLFSPGMG